MDTSWGKLICATGSRAPVLLNKDAITLGRSKDCDVSFNDNHFISSSHCKISKDEAGQVWLSDLSTNGTLLNSAKISNGESLPLAHNDCIHLVKRKKHPENNITFVYQDLKVLEEELQVHFDNTQEIASEDDVTDVETDEDSSQGKTPKRPRTEVSSGDSPTEPESKKPHVAAASADEQNAAESSKIPKLKAHDSIAETLICSICQDIFHDCVSLQPCMHCFCSSCYSQWMEVSSECPTCRDKVEKISRNHIINNLVEAYLREHPERKRSDQELKEMDEKNKITDEMIQPRRRRSRPSARFYDDDDGGDSDEDDSSSGSGRSSASSSSPDPGGYTNPFIFGIHNTFGGLFGFRQASTRIFPVQCRQCPGYSQGGSGSAGNTKGTKTSPSSCASGDDAKDSNTPSTSADATAASSSSVNSQPVYCCPPGASHITCLCCMKPMPHRDVGRPTGAAATAAAMIVDIPPMKCTVCKRAFCHMYWGCQATSCNGCLNKFKDMNFGNNCLDNLINNSAHESEIFKNYINSKSLQVKDVLQKCLEKLDSKEYTSVDSRAFNLSSETVLCYRCGLRNFQDLSYQYRKDIPSDDLPNEVTSRPDCYWGKNCRTQRTRPHHARNFNHVCEQTRFS